MTSNRHAPSTHFWPWTDADPPDAPPWPQWSRRFEAEGLSFQPPDALIATAELLLAWRQCWRTTDADLLPPMDAAELPERAPLWRAAFQDRDLRRDLLRALAGRPDEETRLLELKALLARPAARAHLGATFRAYLDDARAGLADPALAALTDELLDGLEACWRFVDGQAAFLALALPLRAWRGWSLEVLEEDAGVAAEYLALDPLFRRTWEHQRWGLAGDPAPLVGHHYVRGFLLQTLHEAGEDRTEGVRALLNELPAAPLRYYEAGGRPWRRLPPDADSLGLFLQLAAAFGAPEHKVRVWLAPLRPSLRDGVIPTWLYQGPDGPTTDEPRWEWGGDDCDAVRLVLLAGLIDRDPVAWADVIRQNTTAVLDRAEDTGLRAAYYPETYAWLLLGRLAARWGAGLPDALTPLGERLEGACRARAAALVERQRLDGGWGPAGEPSSPQDTACALTLLARYSRDGLALERGLRYLSELQRPDGSWPGEGFFVTSGKAPASLGYHQAPEFTTVLCLRALRVALPAARALREETP